jgi:hypothetical protein
MYRSDACSGFEPESSVHFRTGTWKPINFLLPTHCWRGGLLLYLITLTDTYTLGGTLDEGSARLRGFYLYDTQQIDKRHDIPAPSEVQTRNPNAGLLLRSRGHWDRPI